jgi:hypothetical protein
MKSTFPNMILVSAAVFVTFGYGAERCYEYDSDQYTLLHTWSDAQGKIIKQHLNTSAYRFLMIRPGKLDQLNSHTFALMEKSNGKIIEYNTMECFPFRGTTGGYECQGECDSGHVIVGEQGQLRARVGVLFGETIDSPEGDWELTWKKAGTLLHPQSVDCSPSVAKLARHRVDVDQKYAKEHQALSQEPYRHVCYSQKDLRYVQGTVQPLYVDCEISKDTCTDMGMERFGHYANEDLARAALDRCQHSTPRKQAK